MRKNIITILIIFLTVYICSGKENNTAEHYFKTGEDFYKTYDFENAINAYNKAIEINPNYISAYESKGWAMSKIKNAREMVVCFDKANELRKKQNKNYYKDISSKKDAIDYLSRAAIYFSEDRITEAFSDYDTAIKLDENYAKAYYFRGLIYAQNYREYKKAIVDFNKVLESSPQNSEVFNNRGFCYFCIGDYINAMSDYNKSIKLNPKSIYSYMNRGYGYQKMGAYEKAILDYSKVIKLDSKSAMAYNNRATAYFYAKKYKQAKEDFERAMKLDPNGKNGQSAKENLNKIIQITPY